MGDMSYVFQGIVFASVFLALSYLLMVGYVMRKLYIVHNNDMDKNIQSGIRSSSHKPSGSTLNTKKLFIMSCLLSCLLRFMSFTSLAVFDLSAINYSAMLDVTGSYDDSLTGTDMFFKKAFVVLFDFPDFCIISAYLLLIVVYAEAYLHSRRHWLSNVAFKKTWLKSYIIINTVLYSTQVGLYTLLFIPTVDNDLLSQFIYLALTVFNLVMPLSWLIVYLYLAIKFSGFPYATLAAQQRISKLGSCVTLWTLTRIIWGFMSLTSVLKGWLDFLFTTSLGHNIILIIIFYVVEIIPILYSLNMSIIGTLAEDNPNNTVTQSPFPPQYDSYAYSFPATTVSPLDNSPMLPNGYKGRSNNWTTPASNKGDRNVPGSDYLVSLLGNSGSTPENVILQNTRNPLISSAAGSMESNATIDSAQYSFKSANSYNSDTIDSNVKSSISPMGSYEKPRPISWANWIGLS